VFHDVAALDPGTAVEYRATVLDNGGHTRTSGTAEATVPAPVLTMQSPAEGSNVKGSVEVSATADPEKASHVVTLERSVDGGAWTVLGTDSSSPVYSVADDVSGLADGTRVQYRATMAGPGFTVTSEPRTVTVGDAPQPTSVSVAGSLNQAMGCTNQWDPACPQAMMTLDPADTIWRLTVDLPAGSYEYKAALNGTWDENYGAEGVRNGANLVLEHGGGTVTFTYDHATHVITAG
jgi:hypothetical protein